MAIDRDAYNGCASLLGWLLVTAAVTLLLVSSHGCAAADYLDLSAGAFTAIDGTGSSPSAETALEYRRDAKFLTIGPAAGALVSARGETMLYAGLYSDQAFGQVVLTPFAGAGWYRRGGGKDLGSAFEFRLALTVAYELPDASRIGVAFAHMSNAYTGRINPGDEELLLSYAVPF